ncbi:MAG: hypothetical protein GF355_01730 [Candidatus Eisenbacteria bacterium]|nr:hypothetical protein [Candidatus Eisenbacteria bacterium]
MIGLEDWLLTTVCEAFSIRQGLMGTGQGNRNYFGYDFSGPKGMVEHAQVVNSDAGGAGNYRSVITGYSYHHTTQSFDGEECIPDSAGIAGGIAAQIEAALDWIFDGEPPGYCTDPCVGETSEAPEIPVAPPARSTGRGSPPATTAQACAWCGWISGVEGTRPAVHSGSLRPRHYGLEVRGSRVPRGGALLSCRRLSATAS